MIIMQYWRGANSSVQPNKNLASLIQVSDDIPGNSDSYNENDIRKLYDKINAICNDHNETSALIGFAIQLVGLDSAKIIQLFGKIGINDKNITTLIKIITSYDSNELKQFIFSTRSMYGDDIKQMAMFIISTIEKYNIDQENRKIQDGDSRQYYYKEMVINYDNILSLNHPSTAARYPNVRKIIIENIHEKLFAELIWYYIKNNDKITQIEIQDGVLYYSDQLDYLKRKRRGFDMTIGENVVFASEEDENLIINGISPQILRQPGIEQIPDAATRASLSAFIKEVENNPDSSASKKTFAEKAMSFNNGNPVRLFGKDALIQKWFMGTINCLKNPHYQYTDEEYNKLMDTWCILNECYGVFAEDFIKEVCIHIVRTHYQGAEELVNDTLKRLFGYFRTGQTANMHTLLSGPPGTGKTLFGLVMARALAYLDKLGYLLGTIDLEGIYKMSILNSSNILANPAIVDKLSGRPLDFYNFIKKQLDENDNFSNGKNRQDYREVITGLMNVTDIDTMSDSEARERRIEVNEENLPYLIVCYAFFQAHELALEAANLNSRNYYYLVSLAVQSENVSLLGDRSVFQNSQHGLLTDAHCPLPEFDNPYMEEYKNRLYEIITGIVNLPSCFGIYNDVEDIRLLQDIMSFIRHYSILGLPRVLHFTRSACFFIGDEIDKFMDKHGKLRDTDFLSVMITAGGYMTDKNVNILFRDNGVIILLTSNDNTNLNPALINRLVNFFMKALNSYEKTLALIKFVNDRLKNMDMYRIIYVDPEVIRSIIDINSEPGLRGPKSDIKDVLDGFIIHARSAILAWKRKNGYEVYNDQENLQEGNDNKIAVDMDYLLNHSSENMRTKLDKCHQDLQNEYMPIGQSRMYAINDYGEVYKININVQAINPSIAGNSTPQVALNGPIAGIKRDSSVDGRQTHDYHNEINNFFMNIASDIYELKNFCLYNKLFVEFDKIYSKSIPSFVIGIILATYSLVIKKKIRKYYIVAAALSGNGTIKPINSDTIFEYIKGMYHSSGVVRNGKRLTMFVHKMSANQRKMANDMIQRDNLHLLDLVEVENIKDIIKYIFNQDDQVNAAESSAF